MTDLEQMGAPVTESPETPNAPPAGLRKQPRVEERALETPERPAGPPR